MQTNKKPQAIIKFIKKKTATQQSQQYVLNNDPNVIAYNEQLAPLEQELSEFEQNNNIIRDQNLSPQQRIKIRGYIQYQKTLIEYKKQQNALTNYTNAMNNWQDGEYSFENNGVIIHAEKATLPNGQRAIKIGDKYYEPRLPNAAFPDYDKEIKTD